MSKTKTMYWGTLNEENREKWQWIKGMEGIAAELLLSRDPETEEYTKLTKFLPKADTRKFGSKAHSYPEEVFIVEGRLFDEAVGLWLETGFYASRPPGEVHGPFQTDTGCVVLEVSFPNRTA